MCVCVFVCVVRRYERNKLLVFYVCYNYNRIHRVTMPECTYYVEGSSQTTSRSLRPDNVLRVLTLRSRIGASVYISQFRYSFCDRCDIDNFQRLRYSIRVL